MATKLNSQEAAAFSTWATSMLGMCEAAWRARGYTALVCVGGGTARAELKNEDGTITRRDELVARQMELFERSKPEACVVDEAPAEVHHGLRAGHVIVLEGDEVELVHVDVEGFVWRTVDQGPERDEGSVEWADVKQVTGRVWAARRVKPEVGPARSQKVPAADDLARHGQLIAAYETEGTWRFIARQAGEKAPDWVVRVENLRGDATVTRVRVYSRAGKCTWDSRDGGGL